MAIAKFFRSFFRKPAVPSVRPIARSQEFFLGANLPWITYGCDFGSNAWFPGGGVSNPDHREMLTKYFRDLSETNVRVVRWFMLCDGRAGLLFTRDSVSLDSCVFPDIDVALQTAEQFGIKIMFILFDFYWFHTARSENAVQMGGRGKYIADSSLRRSLLHNVVQPILHRYGRHPAIHSWDVFNEPEWVIRNVGAWRPGASTSLSKFRDFVKEVVHLIHDETDHPATLGLAWRRSLRLFDDCSLDFHQVHWYDKQTDALWTPLESQTPVVLGEFPTSGSRLQVEEILRHAHNAGFAGAIAWSARDSVVLSSFSSLVAGFTEFRRNILPASAPDNSSPPGTG